MIIPRAALHLMMLAAAIACSGCATTRAPPRPSSEAFAIPDVGPVVVEPLPLPLPQPTKPAATAGSDPGSDIALRAMAYLGVPYRFGGDTPDSGFDCSGFVRWVYREQPNVELPRASQEMARFAAPSVEPQALRAGDLVFFRIRGSRISHVGIYIGDERFVHAPSRGGRVRIDRLDDRYWQRRFAGAKRVLATH
jgi:hypothetical protein